MPTILDRWFLYSTKSNGKNILFTNIISISFVVLICNDMAKISEDKRALISRLKKNMLLWQGVRPKESQEDSIGLGPMEEAFPNGIFPKGSVHEFISTDRIGSAVSCGFMSGLLGNLMKNGGICIWISSFKALFPASLKTFGVTPEHIVFVRMKHEKDILWAMEEALKCEGLAAVIAEIHKLDFVQSRRLQLAVEKSRVTGFILRHNPRSLDSTACAARWRITSLPSKLKENMPGIGFPRWEVELLKVRNGNPGKWRVEWSADGLIPLRKQSQSEKWSQRIQHLG